MSSEKPVVLVNWNYQRKDLLEIFEDLSFTKRIIFIFYADSRDDNLITFPFTRIYWNNYASPYELLEDIKPTKIVFHDVESFHQVGLNLAAKNAHLNTYILEHGLRLEMEVDIELDDNKYKSVLKKKSKYSTINSSPSNSLKTLLFYLKALKWQNIKILPFYMHFALMRKHNGITSGLFRAKYEFRQATKYINFSEFNAGYIFKRDGVDKQKMDFIGNPFLDKIINKISSQSPKKNYYLLIDNPYIEARHYNMSIDERVNFILRLNEFCLNKKRKLYIKLHPLSYESTYFPIHQNICYYKEADIAGLISSAHGVMGVYLSTLTPIALLNAPYIHFKSVHSYDIDSVLEEYIKLYSFEDFSIDELKFSHIDEVNKRRIVEKFLFKNDGRSTERLLNILNS